MDREFVSIEGRSRGYRITVAVLGVVVLAGLGAFIASYIEGHQFLGGNNVIPWGLPIVIAIYLIGLSAGSLILSSLTYVFGKEEYRPVARMAVYLALVLILGAMLAILVDLGRPEKFWRLFAFFSLNNMSSMFAVNSILYGVYFIISLVYLGVIFGGKKQAARITGMIAVGWAVLVHMGTGAIFGFVAAREAWFSPLKPLEFLAAALTSGVALLILVVFLANRYSGRRIKPEITASLGRFLSAFIIILLILIVVDKLTHLYAPRREATEYMLAGPSAWMFWVLQVGLGAIVPLAILFTPGFRKATGWVAAAALAVVVGVFFERYYLVIPGAAFPQAYAGPGKIEGVWGSLQSFTLTPVELLMAAGLLALVGLVFILGFRYLELLPAVTLPEEAPEPVENKQIEEDDKGGQHGP